MSGAEVPEEPGRKLTWDMEEMVAQGTCASTTWQSEVVPCHEFGETLDGPDWAWSGPRPVKKVKQPDWYVSDFLDIWNGRQRRRSYDGAGEAFAYHYKRACAVFPEGRNDAEESVRQELVHRWTSARSLRPKHASDVLSDEFGVYLIVATYADEPGIDETTRAVRKAYEDVFLGGTTGTEVMTQADEGVRQSDVMLRNRELGG